MLWQSQFNRTKTGIYACAYPSVEDLQAVLLGERVENLFEGCLLARVLLDCVLSLELLHNRVEAPIR